ncbi:hypothetical protein E0494_07300 [Marinilabiliaceae bacterium JC040]|nr:hypothetical protein [Marinilabiliaceae bacterium JC040]
MMKRILAFISLVFLLFACGSDEKDPVLVPDSLKLNVDELFISKTGKPVQLAAIIKPMSVPAEGVWTTSDMTIAAVSEDGIVNPMKNGKALITFTMSSNRQQASCIVNVQEEVQDISSVELSKEFLSLNVGDTRGIFATIIPKNADNKSLLWGSEDDSIASINEEGLVRANSAGTTFVYIKTVNNIVTKCKVDVIDSKSCLPKALCGIYSATKLDSISVNKGEVFTQEQMISQGSITKDKLEEYLKAYSLKIYSNGEVNIIYHQYSDYYNKGKIVKTDLENIYKVYVNTDCLYLGEGKTSSYTINADLSELDIVYSDGMVQVFEKTYKSNIIRKYFKKDE